MPMKKYILSIIAVLMLLALAVAFAEEASQYESLSITTGDRDEDFIMPIYLSALGYDGVKLMDYCCPDELETLLSVKVYAIKSEGNTFLFSQAIQTSWESPVAYYGLHTFDNEGLHTLLTAYDAGFTDGTGLYTTQNIGEEEPNSLLVTYGFEAAQSEYIRALESAFNALGAKTVFEFKQLSLDESVVFAQLNEDDALLLLEISGKGQTINIVEVSEPPEGEDVQAQVAETEDAQQAADAYACVKATANVNIRTGIGTGYKVLGTLKKGSTVKYLGQTDKDKNKVDWFKVEYNGSEGWVSSKYSVISTDEALYKQKETQTGETEAADTGSYIIASGNVNVRKGPGFKYGVLTVLKKGQTAAYTGESNIETAGEIWLKITVNGEEGWVLAEYAEIKQ